MMLYDLLKAGHVVAVVMWFGGVMSAALVLTRGSRETVARFRSWDRSVAAPAMAATWVLGLTLAIWGGWFASGWLVTKLVFVLALSAVHGILSGRLRRAGTEGEAAVDRIVRFALPAAVLCLGVIVLLVITKAF